MQKHVSYLSGFMRHDVREELVHILADLIQSIGGIDYIAVRGTSGITMGSVVSWVTGIPLIIVRKDETCHSSYMCEVGDDYEYAEHSYIILDDLIDSGRTVRKIREEIQRHIGRNMTCIGFIGYDRIVDYDDMWEGVDDRPISSDTLILVTDEGTVCASSVYTASAYDQVLYGIID